MRSFRDREEIDYEFLLDPEGKTFDAYGIRNQRKDKTVPHPTVVVVGAKGVARYVVSDENYRKRPPSSEVLAAARKLTAGNGR